MSTRPITMNVSLTPELEEMVKSRVASGRYQSSSEVVREALRLLEARDAEREAALAEVRAKIAVGVEQIKRGEVIDGETARREIQKRGRGSRAA